MTIETCWYDRIGDEWEAEGVDPGRIFECHNALADGYMIGVMVKSADHIPPGKMPTRVDQIGKVCVRRTDGTEVQYPGRHRLVVDNFRYFRNGMH